MAQFRFEGSFVVGLAAGKWSGSLESERALGHLWNHQVDPYSGPEAVHFKVSSWYVSELTTSRKMRTVRNRPNLFYYRAFWSGPLDSRC